MQMIRIEALAYLTEDEQGIGGRIKQRPEDFMVDEVPLYEPCGSGQHLYLRVEKVRRLTTDVVRMFSQHFKAPWDAIGYAGLKDKQAVTSQWFSVDRGDEQLAGGFEAHNIRIIDVSRHVNKLKRGHLRGNRFRIRVREADPAGIVRARRILHTLARRGAPNFLGEQRFGYRNNNHILGRHLLMGDFKAFLDDMLGKPQDIEPPLNHEARRAYEAGDYQHALDLWPTVHRFERQALGPLARGATAAQAINCIDKPHRQLLISAFQSAIFNRLLDQRMRDGLYDKLLVGDLAFKHDSRAVFLVEDPDVEQPRCDRLEISPTGPMWGRKMQLAGGQVGQWEFEALAETGVPVDRFEGPYGSEGTRRAMRMPILDPQVSAGADEHGPYVEACFELPRGCFATIVMREIIKSPSSTESGEDPPVADEVD